MDTLAFRYQQSIFSKEDFARRWWDPGISWKSKWKNDDPRQGEAFPLSSTTLVSVTDAWHFFKTIAIFCILTAIILPFAKLFHAVWPVWVGVFIGLYLSYGLIFETLFAHLLIG